MKTASVVVFVALMAGTAAAQYCHNASGDCYALGAFSGSSCNAGYTQNATPCVTATPTPAPTKTPTPVPPMTVKRVDAFKMTPTAFWYAPECIVPPPPVLPRASAGQLAAGAQLAQDNPYWCFPTEGDHIQLYTSPDRLNWTMRQTVFQALPGTWEDDGNAPAGSPVVTTGVSNFVVSQSRINGALIAAYSAGKSPNNWASGGMGLAYSWDWGIHWFRFKDNPVLKITGFEFTDRMLRISGVLWVYIHNKNGDVARIMVEEMGGYPGGFETLPDLNGYTVIGYDSNGCWLTHPTGTLQSQGFPSLEVYAKSDCVKTRGGLVATIKASDFGKTGIAGAAFVERSLEGGLLGGPSMILSVGNTRQEWRPVMVTLGPQVGVTMPPVFVPSRGGSQL